MSEGHRPLARRALRRTHRAVAGAGLRGVARGLVLGLVIALSLIGCIVRRLTGPQLTGTCDGACAHYVQCKRAHAMTDRTRCLSECPDVFSDRDSLMAYESLTCDDAVEYVDGSAAKTAKSSAGHP